MKSLEGKVAVVTGAGQGVGRSEALLLARHGAAVVVNDRGVAGDGSGNDTTLAQVVVDEIVAAGGRAAANVDDVADWEGGQGLIRQAIETFGSLDIVVCNAGIVRDRVIFNLAEDDWDAVIRVHLKGHFVPTRFATAYWREQSKAGKPVAGRLVYTSSLAIFGHDGQTNYSAAKAGIVAMGLAVAREMRRFGVTCNMVCPRARTRMTEGAFGTFEDPDGFDSWDPDNVAPMVAYLSTDEAAHITGQTFCMGGGTADLVEGPQIASTVVIDRPWDVADVADAMTTLLDGRESDCGPFPAFDIPLSGQSS